MPVFNRERFVAQAVRSVLAQPEADLELLVCDDGSGDGSVSAAREAIGGDRRATLHAWEHQGLTHTLARAHELAKGDLLGWVDSDDVLHAGAVARCVRALTEHPQAGMVYTHHDMIDERGKSLGVGARCAIAYSPQRLLVDFMTFHFRLFRRGAFEQCGGINTQMSVAQDYDLCLRMSEVAQIVCVPSVLYSYRTSSDSISNAKRLEQIEASAGAVRRALQRRGMAEKVELSVDIVARFSIRPRGQGGWSQA